MTALTPTYVETIDSRVDKCYGSAARRLRDVYIECTSTATSNTIDLDTYVDGDISGIAGVKMSTVDGAVDTTYPTWSSTTLTLAQHAGSGGCKMIVTVY